MKKLTNKELASALLQLYTESDSMWARKRLELAAERLEAMPDGVDQEPAASITLARNLFNGQVVELYSENYSLGPGTHELYTKPQQPAPDKETIKRYCILVAEYLDSVDWTQFDYDYSKAFDSFWEGING